MRVRAKFTLHQGTTSAGLYADGTLLTAGVTTGHFPCPYDPGLDCLDVELPPADPAHVFELQLREAPSGVMTAIAVPATAATGSRYHPLIVPSLIGVFLAVALFGVPWWRARRIAGGLLLGLAIGVASAEAGGSAVVTWTQSADCPAVTGWELLAVPITTGQPNPQPTAATFQASIANAPPVVCGLGATKMVPVNGIGPTRFWLRAVAASTKSAESLPVDVSLPLARPSGLTVVVP